MKEDKALNNLIQSKDKEAAIVYVKEKYNVSLKEADEYVSSLIFKEETAVAKKNTRKKRITITLSILVGAVVIWFSLAVRQAQKETDRFFEIADSIDTELYGPSTYDGAFLYISSDSTMTQEQQIDLYIKLNKLKMQGVPYKETFYWREYLEKKRSKE